VLRRSVESAQYCAHDYQKLVKQFGMQPSMSRRGNCYDNAPMESFWGMVAQREVRVHVVRPAVLLARNLDAWDKSVTYECEAVTITL
jgi:transposase InsO family protein